MDFIELFKNQMSADNIVIQERIIADGELHRFHIEGDSPNSKNGWYILHSNYIQGGAYGCWKRNISKTWCFKSKNEMTPVEWERCQTHIKEANVKRDKAKAEAQANARVKALKLWNNSTPASDRHPYLLKKKVKAHGIRCLKSKDKNVLLIPLLDNEGTLHSLQFINESGEKLFLTDGLIAGNYFVIGSLQNNTDKIGLVEGVATGAQLYQILECHIVCAMNCGNLLAVAKVIRKEYPRVEITIFADNDQWSDKNGTVNNPGLTKARQAAEAIGATIHYPDFTGFDLSSFPTDWNDLVLIAGIEETRRQLLTIANDEPLPLPDELSDVMKFDPEMLPESIRAYVSDIADRQQCPIDFVAVTAICGLAAVLGRKALVRPKQLDNWTVTANLWGAIIGRPSAMKSPAMKAALEPLYLIESEAAKEYESAKQEYKINQVIAELSSSSVREEAKKLIKKKNPDQAKIIIQEAALSAAEQLPTRKRLVVNDATVEKLGELLNENPNGLILVRDELSGWLLKLNKEEFHTDRAFYLECFNGSSRFVYDRIGRGTISINNLTLSVIGGIQPSKITPLIRDLVRGASDDGLIQRLQVTVWPNDIGSWEWIDKAPNEEAYTSYMNAFNKLHNLNFNTEEPPCFRFSPEAQIIFIKWMEEIQTVARSGDIHPAIESHLLKMPETVASLALLFEFLDSGIKTKSIGLLSTARALEWADYLRSHAERLYSVAKNPGLAGAHLILKRFNRLEDAFTARDILRKQWSGLTESREIEEALSCLVDYKHLTSRDVPTTSLGGRATVIYTKRSL